MLLKEGKIMLHYFLRMSNIHDLSPSHNKDYVYCLYMTLKSKKRHFYGFIWKLAKANDRQTPSWHFQPIPFRLVPSGTCRHEPGSLHKWLVGSADQSEAAVYSKVVNPQQ